MADPYLSVVVTSRNDNHGDSLLRRMQTFINAFLGQCRRHALNAELIIVEWNPPGDRPRLVDVLEWPADLGSCPIRFIEVPEELHRRLNHADQLPMFQMIAKNVGIRRARGRFVLATNIDILFSDELCRFLAAGKLQQGNLYRMDRHDVETMVPVNAPVPEQLAYCRTHLLRVFAEEAIFPLTSNGHRRAEPDDILTEESGMRLGRGWFALEAYDGERYRWVGDRACFEWEAPKPGLVPMTIELESGDGVGARPINLEVRDDRGTLVAQGFVQGRQRVSFDLPADARGFVLSTKEGSVRSPWPWDLRRLNFRVFHISQDPINEGVSIGLNCRAVDVCRRRDRDLGTARFGRGWGQPEGDERFRWAFAEAVLELPEHRAENEVLTLELEPGPGVSVDNLHLQVRTVRGDLIGRVLIQGRQIVQIRLPKDLSERTFVVRAEEAEPLPATWPKSMLPPAFRLFDARWAHALKDFQECYVEDVGVLLPDDVADPADGIRLGRGWHDLESTNGEVMRWAGPDAVLCLRSPIFGLHLEIEPGPGVGVEPLQLEVRDQTGRKWAETTVVGRRRISLSLPEATPRHLLLHVPNGGRDNPWTGDPRICNFRVFHIGTKPRNKAQATVWSRWLSRSLRWLSQRRLRDQLSDALPAALPQPARVVPCPLLHTNACGDFTLLARDDWFRVRGYSERQVHSMHLDSLFCYTAYYAGIQQVILEDPIRIYHIEHGFASGWTPEGGATHLDQVRRRGIAILSFEDILDLATRMHWERRAILDNDENWGFADQPLHEAIVRRRSPIARSA